MSTVNEDLSRTAGSREAGGIHRRTSSCRSCNGDRLETFLSFGRVPLANAFLRSPAEFADEPRFPLSVQFCRSCSLVQLADVIDPEALFRDYIYTTGVSQTMAAHNVRYAEKATRWLGLGANDLVVEAASNDGSLLQCFQSRGVRTLGVEPAANIAAMARSAGIETLERFFDSAVANEVRHSYGAASAVIANNVLAHVDDPRDFLQGARRLLEDDGVLIVEVPYLRDLLARLEYDTIYHEHLCYFSVRSLRDLLESAGLGIVRVERLPVHGGSLRIYASPSASGRTAGSEAATLIEEEEALGLAELATYERFAAEVAASRTALLERLNALSGEGRTLAAYGAPAKSATLLNYCGVDNRQLPYTVDRSKLKTGRYTPGSHIPVLPVETLLERQPDYVLLLAWNFADEILAQQREFRRRGGRFLLPLPKPEVLS